MLILLTHSKAPRLLRGRIEHDFEFDKNPSTKHDDTYIDSVEIKFIFVDYRT